jgi:sporulation protein YlmC with PRC-barrel domain
LPFSNGAPKFQGAGPLSGCATQASYTNKLMKINQQLVTWGAALLCLGLTSTARSQDENQAKSDAPSDSSRMSTETMGGAPTRFNKASKLIGTEVQNEQGENLGEIKDIVINFDNGAVSYAVLSAGGVLGVGEKLLAVPLTAFRRSADNKHLLLQASKNNISQAQSIGDNWPSVEHPNFGAMPFWQQSATNAMQMPNK